MSLKDELERTSFNQIVKTFRRWYAKQLFFGTSNRLVCKNKNNIPLVHRSAHVGAVIVSSGGLVDHRMPEDKFTTLKLPFRQLLAATT